MVNDDWKHNRWFTMTYELQISNVGSEVHRAIKYKNRGDDNMKKNMTHKAIEFLQYMIEDPSNKDKIEEIEFRITQLIDYFMGENYLETTDAELIQFYDRYLTDI